jgi:hypothetical protein
LLSKWLVLANRFQDHFSDFKRAPLEGAFFMAKQRF